MWRDIVELVQVSETRNEYREVVYVESSSAQVFANKKSVRQSEFYQAFAAGLRPEIMFEIRCAEYSGEPKLRHNGTEYRVIRTYSKNDETMELVCSRYPMEG